MRIIVLVAVAASCLLATSASGLEKCKAKIRPSDGSVLISAKSVDGALQWGYSSGRVGNAVADPSCFSSGTARNCQLAASAPVSITPPEECTVHLSDDSSTCSAYIKKCTPGLRRNVEPLGGGVASPGSINAPGGDECIIGEVRLFAGNFAPRNFTVAHGQELPISPYTALFSIFGTNYGGDGRTTFAVPDMRGLEPAGVSYMVCVNGRFPSRS